MSLGFTLSKHSDSFKFIFGLSGGIGCGKSTALKIFSELGCIVMESDKLCHELYADIGVNGTNFRKNIMSRWAERIISDSQIDRKKIAQIVFNNKNELEWLNSIVHPYIFNKAYEIIASSDRKSVVIFDIPLLFELGIEKEFCSTITIWTNRELQIKRLKERNWTDNEIKARLGSQLSPDIKLEKATFGIINTGDLNLLHKQCKQILVNIKKGFQHDTGKQSADATAKRGSGNSY